MAIAHRSTYIGADLNQPVKKLETIARHRWETSHIPSFARVYDPAIQEIGTSGCCDKYVQRDEKKSGDNIILDTV